LGTTENRGAPPLDSPISTRGTGNGGGAGPTAHRVQRDHHDYDRTGSASSHDGPAAGRRRSAHDDHTGPQTDSRFSHNATARGPM
jgi:hypothetical protein